MKSRVRGRDLFAEALAGVLQRRTRALLTTLGTVLGVGAFVVVSGLTSSATGQVSKRFTVLAATEVTVHDAGPGAGRDPSQPAFPADADARVRQIDGVTYAGVSWMVPPERSGDVAGVLLTGEVGTQQQVIAADPGLLAAAAARIRTGRVFDNVHNRRAERVAVLGSAVAHQLGITQLSHRPAIFIGGISFTVMGIIDDVKRRPELLLAVVVPRRTAERLWPSRPGEVLPQTMLIETRLGAAKVVSEQVAVALRPDEPERFKVTAPPDPRSLRDAVNRDLGALFLLLAAVCLVIGTVGIANSTLVAVLERVPEIGLRRALGARPRHIAAQFLTESALQGSVGGLIGTSLGIVIVVAVAIARHWTPILQPWTVVPAPLLGTVVGLLAGAYPALRAASIEPVEALRR